MEGWEKRRRGRERVRSGKGEERGWFGEGVFVEEEGEEEGGWEGT